MVATLGGSPIMGDPASGIIPGGMPGGIPIMEEGSDSASGAVMGIANTGLSSRPSPYANGRLSVS